MALEDLGQKIKGKAQELEGDLQQKNGQPLSGAVNKLKGKVNSFMADTKMNTDEEYRR